MAYDLFIDKETNDIVIDKGELRLTDSKPEILRQSLSITLKTWVGEWFNNIEIGGINRGILFNKGVTKTEVDAWFRSIVLGFEEVNRIKTWESTFDRFNRDYDLTFSVETDEGDVNLFIATAPPSADTSYTQVLPPEDTIVCEDSANEDDLISLANRLHEALFYTLYQGVFSYTEHNGEDIEGSAYFYQVTVADVPKTQTHNLYLGFAPLDYTGSYVGEEAPSLGFSDSGTSQSGTAPDFTSAYEVQAGDIIGIGADLYGPGDPEVDLYVWNGSSWDYKSRNYFLNQVFDDLVPAYTMISGEAELYYNGSPDVIPTGYAAWESEAPGGAGNDFESNKSNKWSKPYHPENAGLIYYPDTQFAKYDWVNKAWRNIRGLTGRGSVGKYYFEVVLHSFEVVTDSDFLAVGVGETPIDIDEIVGISQPDKSVGYIITNSGGVNTVEYTVDRTDTGTTWAAGDVVGIGVDFPNETLQYFLNGSLVHTGIIPRNQTNRPMVSAYGKFEVELIAGGTAPAGYTYWVVE